jgi:acyl carrier protein
MNHDRDDVVRRAVARYLRIDHTTIDPAAHLQRDLHLQPLDVVLIVLAVEDLETILFPIAHLVSVATVADLMRLFRGASAKPRHAGEPNLVPMHRGERQMRVLRRQGQV